MDSIIFAALGAGGVVLLILVKLYGWDKVRAWLQARATAAENAVKAKADAATSDLQAKVTAALDPRLTALETDLKAVKTKLGL